MFVSYLGLDLGLDLRSIGVGRDILVFSIRSGEMVRGEGPR